MSGYCKLILSTLTSESYCHTRVSCRSACFSWHCSISVAYTAVFSLQRKKQLLYKLHISTQIFWQLSVSIMFGSCALNSQIQLLYQWSQTSSHPCSLCCSAHWTCLFFHVISCSRRLHINLAFYFLLETKITSRIVVHEQQEDPPSASLLTEENHLNPTQVLTSTEQGHVGMQQTPYSSPKPAIAGWWLNSA